MRIGVVTDATCDLPPEFFRDNQIVVLPVAIRLGEETLEDVRDPQLTQRFYAEQLAAKGLDADTAAYSAVQIRERFLERIVLDYDYVFCVTVMSSRSPTFENATKASFAILNDYKKVRAEAGISGSFALRVVDSRALFAGTGVLVAEAAKLAQRGASPNEIRTRLDDLREHICTYIVPGDLYYIRNRAARKGEKSVNFLTYALGTALDIKPVILCFRGDTQPIAKIRGYERAVERTFTHVAHQIERGVDTRHVCVSYGGELAELEALPGYELLSRAARKHNIDLLASVMSATAGVNQGSKTVTIAYGGELRSFGD
jgi:DegV family protein with EDD domain